MIDLYTNGSSHQIGAMQALGEAVGVKEIRHFDRLLKVRTTHDICAIWGTRNLERMFELYEAVVVLERGFYLDRLRYYSIGFNGLNGRADFANKHSTPDRWVSHGVGLKPWKRDGEFYVVMGQVEGDMSIKGINIRQWYADIIAELKLKTTKPILFRPHPLSRNNPLVESSTGTLDEVLSRAAGVITFNSNSGVDAVIAGVPTMTEDVGSMAWDVTAHTVDDLLNFSYPDRKQWAYNLANCQWTINELADGTAWDHLCN